MIQIEQSFFDLAEASERNCLVICDRGAMDASAFVSRKDWEELLAQNHMDEVDIRDNRYNQVRMNIFQVSFRIFLLIGKIFAGCSHGDGSQWS